MRIVRTEEIRGNVVNLWRKVGIVLPLP